MTRASRCGAAQVEVQPQDLVEAVAHALPRVEGGVGVLEDDLHLAAEPPPLPGAETARACARDRR